jgi:ribose-phosphate pyrophosphokinase
MTPALSTPLCDSDAFAPRLQQQRALRPRTAASAAPGRRNQAPTTGAAALPLCARHAPLRWQNTEGHPRQRCYALFVASAVAEGQTSGGKDEAGGGRLRLLSGSAHTHLAEEISHYLGTPLTAVLRKRFADGECYIQVQETIRGCDMFLLQPTCSPVADNLMELMLMVDACRRASARSITVVIPYFGYARADRKSSAREAIAAKLVANLLTESGANRVVGLDLHSGQLEGYFDLPVVHVQAGPLLARYIARACTLSNVVVVSPDVGGVSRARVFAKALSDAPLAIIDKRRTGHNQAQTMNLIGDVTGRDAVLVDDMIDTAGTLHAGAELLHAKGARAVYAVASHALFSGPAVDRLKGGLFKEVVVTNSIPLPPSKQFEGLTVLSVAALIGETIRRVQSEQSVTGVLSGADP